MVKCRGRGLVVKRPGVLSKVQMLNLVLGVGVFSLLPRTGHVFAKFVKGRRGESFQSSSDEQSARGQLEFRHTILSANTTD